MQENILHHIWNCWTGAGTQHACAQTLNHSYRVHLRCIETPIYMQITLHTPHALARIHTHTHKAFLTFSSASWFHQ